MSIHAWPALALLVIAPFVSGQPALGIDTSVGSFQTDTGDITHFNTTITNNESVALARILVVLNIASFGDGAPVDPEDWSPERAQIVPSLAPGQSMTLNWTLFSILEGDYVVYVVAIPEPNGPTSSTSPVSSPALHLTVQGVAQYNPGGVLPITLGVPTMAALGSFALRTWRHRGLDKQPKETV
ncbi:MAG: hypothetical protein WC876_03485 [Candidatus Thermoplasmatota archaeon]|jgi:hypothetical protein